VKRTSRRPAQALVEMGISLIPLAIVLVGIVQVAVFLYAQHVVEAAVEDGARVGSAQRRSVDEGVSYAKQLVRVGLGPTASDVAIAGHADGQWVVLDSRGTLPLIIPWIPLWRLPLNAEARARQETFRPGGTDTP
jgi:hypothetical protein